MIINYLAIIPARSGSKGIKDKNIKLINGKESFRYTLEPLIKSNIDKIFFSTDSINYLNLYKKYYDKNKDVTGDYIRNSNISDDKSIFTDYVNNCLDYLKKKGDIIKNFIILQPTSLFRTTEQINKIIKFHKENNYITVKSVSPVIQTPYYMLYDDNSQVVTNKHFNRQEHKDIYILNGAYYIYSLNRFLSNEQTFIKYVMKKYESFDLDDSFDLKIIKLLLKNINLFIE